MYRKFIFSINLAHASAKTNLNISFLYSTFFSTNNIYKRNSDIINKIVDLPSLFDRIWFYTKTLNAKVIYNIKTKLFSSEHFFVQSIPEEL